MTAQNNRTTIAKAITDTLISPNEADRNAEAANVVDGLFALARAIHNGSEKISRPLDKIAEAIVISAIHKTEPKRTISKTQGDH